VRENEDLVVDINKKASMEGLTEKKIIAMNGDIKKCEAKRNERHI